MAVTIGTKYSADLSKPSPQLNTLGTKFCIASVTFDSSYAVGGEAITASSFGMDEIVAISFGNDDLYDFEWDSTNSKILVRYKGEPGVTLTLVDDDSASSNGTALHVDSTLATVSGDLSNLTSVCANNADAVLQAGSATGPKSVVQDDNSAASNATDLYFDETNKKFLSTIATNTDVRIPMSNGSYIHVFDDDSASSGTVVVYFDDNAANAYERALIIATGNADIDVRLDEVANGTDLSAVAVQAFVWGR